VPISNRLAINHPWERGFKFVQNKGEHSSTRGDNGKNVKKIFFKNLL
jgi:hypothetical protein